MISVYGYEVGKPLIEPTMNEVFCCPCDCAGMDDCNEVSTAVEE
jgi:hypothetical protein